MGNNFLMFLDQNLFVDDERDTVLKDNINNGVSILERVVNCFGFKPKKQYDELIDWYKDKGHPKLEYATNYAKNKLFYLALQWIDFYGNNPIQTPNLPVSVYGIGIDPRNQMAKERCVEISIMPEFTELLNFYGHSIDYNERPDYSEALQYYEFMRMINTRMHRTNQQTATELMLYALSTVTDVRAKKIVSKLTDKYGDDYWELPMI